VAAASCKYRLAAAAAANRTGAVYESSCSMFNVQCSTVMALQQSSLEKTQRQLSRKHSRQSSSSCAELGS
jgi:hypothetical protein